MVNRKPPSKPAPAPASSNTPLLSEIRTKRVSPANKTVRLVPPRKTCIRMTGLVGFFLLIYTVLFRNSPPHNKTNPVNDGGYEYKLRIVAVGDLHSDLDNTLKVLQRSHVIDRNGDWTGEIDYFVQTGDIVDRGDDTLKIYQLIEKLRIQAREAGGDVFSHLGNHEYMNVLSDWRYVYPSEIETFGGVEKRQFALSSEGFPGAAWATNYTAVSRIPLHPASGSPNEDFSRSSSPLSLAAYSFMHGGLSPRIAQQYGYPYPSRLNAIGASLLRRCQTRTPQPPPHPPAPYQGLPSDSPQEEQDFYGGDGPVWFRGWAEAPEQLVCSAVDDVTNLIGVRRLIMGHTPNFKNIVSRCNGKIIIIDTGISRAYGGALSALSITYTLEPISSSSGAAFVDNLNSTSLPNVTAHADFANITNLTSFARLPNRDNSSVNVTQEESSRRIGKWREREHIEALYHPNRREDLVIEERIITGDFWV